MLALLPTTWAGAGELTGVSGIAAQPHLLVGVVARWLSNKTIKCNTRLQWVPNLFMSALLKLGSKRALDGLKFQPHLWAFLRSCTLLTKLTEQLGLVESCLLAFVTGTSPARCSASRCLCLAFQWWPSLPASQPTSSCRGRSWWEGVCYQGCSTLGRYIR